MGVARLLIALLIPVLPEALAEVVSSGEKAAHVYTLAPKFPPGEELTYGEISQPWRRITRDKIKLVRLPATDVSRLKGPCGTLHYSPDLLALTPEQLKEQKAGRTVSGGIQTQQEVGSYLTETAACVMMDVMQEWTKECDVHTDGKNVCALSWGDSSHRDSKKFEPHSVKYHGYGECIDIRPIRRGTLEEFKTKHADDPELPLYLRNGDYRQWPISHVDDFYDRAMTRKLLHLLNAKGGQPIFFIDPKMRESAKALGEPVPAYQDVKGHANHIHVCFPDNKKTREVCKKFRYQRALCGEPLH